MEQKDVIQPTFAQKVLEVIMKRKFKKDSSDKKKANLSKGLDKLIVR